MNTRDTHSHFNSPLATRHSSLGMTLVEILVVLGVIGLILGMGVPALLEYSKGVRLKTTTRQLVGLITLARSWAISSRQEYAVIVDQEHRQVHIVNDVSGETLEQVFRLPEAVSLEMQAGGAPIAEWKLAFRPTGSLAGRTVSIVVSDGKREQTIIVTGVTGAVSVH